MCDSERLGGGKTILVVVAFVYYGMRRVGDTGFIVSSCDIALVQGIKGLLVGWRRPGGVAPEDGGRPIPMAARTSGGPFRHRVLDHAPPFNGG